LLRSWAALSFVSCPGAGLKTPLQASRRIPLLPPPAAAGSRPSELRTCDFAVARARSRTLPHVRSAGERTCDSGGWANHVVQGPVRPRPSWRERRLPSPDRLRDVPAIQVPVGCPFPGAQPGPLADAALVSALRSLVAAGFHGKSSALGHHPNPSDGVARSRPVAAIRGQAALRRSDAGRVANRASWACSSRRASSVVMVGSLASPRKRMSVPRPLTLVRGGLSSLLKPNWSPMKDRSVELSAASTPPNTCRSVGGSAATPQAAHSYTDRRCRI
jgi:hypothetical protein